MRQLSVEQCRKGLGGDCALSDAEIELLRNYLYAAAESGIELFKRLPLLYEPEEYHEPDLDYWRGR